jgi:5-methylthioadenosine/S-adenosylhomocysteine deaminase
VACHGQGRGHRAPFSNLWLYGKTTDVVAAGKAGLIVCLGADWSPSGSKSVLGELKVADLHSKVALGGALTDRDLCAMVTCNPAQALGWENLVGRLKAGLRGDFVVMAAKGADKDAYRTLIESVEADVLLVAINGYPIYGTADLMTVASAVNPDPIQLNPGLKRRITLRDARIPDADVSWTDVLARLEAARHDPAAARTQALALDQAAEPPVALVPDKAWDDPTVHPELLEEAVAATIPPVDPLTPDEAFFAALSKRTADMGDGSGLHALDTLHAYYSL